MPLFDGPVATFIRIAVYFNDAECRLAAKTK